MVVYQLIPSSFHQPSGSQEWNLGTGFTQNPNSQNYLSLLVTPEDATTNNSESNPPQTTLTNNILPATITKNESLAAIFSFELEKTINPPLFNEAALKEKPTTVMYTNVKVDGHSIKLILNSGSAGSIITRQLMDQLANGATKTLIREIDNFSIEVNDIIVPIKVLVIEATQYQALIGNNWLSKTNATLDWNTQELQLSWNTYQVSWADVNYNELLPIFVWDNNDNGKKKQREELTWKATINA
ncbi:hypothetical protein G9A89_022608 [Geosiphon pyriformis]|nr:hypothetical protein G9A89_022608 [Geosiphon pyriformis]